jgi:hypothetical protein
VTFQFPIIPSLFWIFSVYIIIYLGIFLFWPCLFSVLKASCACVILSFLRLGQSSTIILFNKLSVSLVCISSRSSIAHDLKVWWCPRGLECFIHVFLVFFTLSKTIWSDLYFNFGLNYALSDMSTTTPTCFQSTFAYKIFSHSFTVS